MPALSLTPAERSALRSAAHRLSPVVTIGKAGLTPALLAEAGRALASHGLVKVRALAGEREERVAWLDELAERLDAGAVQAIGRILVLYRPTDKPSPALAGTLAGARPRSAATSGPAPSRSQRPGAKTRASR